ncbi:MAG: RNA methyltransferase [Thermodesulfobacteriota bacterium]|nr:RNA methyltransferase [Thermodesulfobacteriota bacterium]
MLRNTAIVLVEPQGALNIGSVCRVMMNFGFHDLRIVNPRVDHLSDEARHMAVKAGALLDKAVVFSDLAEAVADCHLVFGTTRRFGKYREEFIGPDAIGERLLTLPPSNRAALVFGREDHGLTTAELDFCQVLVTIPTRDELPSMNLAQAVCLCLYEIEKKIDDRRTRIPETRTPALSQNLESMYQHMRQTLLDIEYLDPQNPDHILRAFRRIFSRSDLTEREVLILQGLWSRIDWLDGQRRN